MEVTILGCGSSLGVPVIGCKCVVCMSTDSKNQRFRSSVLISQADINILIDTGPDLRMQALSNNISKVNAIIYTHAHADHVNGLDEVRAFQNNTIEIYGNLETLESLKHNFSYLFTEVNKNFKWHRPNLKTNIVNIGDKIKIDGFNIEIFEQIHGKSQSLGYKINDKLAYSTDVSEFSKETLELLENIDVWIVDCLSESESFSHACLKQVLAWIEIVKPKKAILTHLNHEMEYKKLSDLLPKNIEVAYDNMKITI
ncbi:MAG: MBL fold metallo-hydrolase [Alphaproteobacteria bacterium]